MQILVDVPRPVREPFEIDDRYAPLIKFFEENPDLSWDEADNGEEIERLYEDFCEQYVNYAQFGTKFYTKDGVLFAEY